MEDVTRTPAELLEIIRIRKWSLVLPMLALVLVGTVIALALPSYFRSTATILIEEQEIPANFVMTTVTSYAEQRLQTINQRIMTSTRMLEVIKKLDLYADIKNKRSSEELVTKMREDIALETISSEVVDRRTGRPMMATIAFTLSYEGKDPNKVQKVTSLLTSYFLEENLKVRERQSMETSVFLEEEVGKVKTELDEIEETLSKFKEKHINELPELLQVNLRILDNIDVNIGRLNENLRSLRERKSYLEIQKASFTPDIEPDLDKKRIEELKLKLMALKTKFSDEYPDVIKLKSEIDALERHLEEKNRAGGRDDREPNPMYVSTSAQLAGIVSEIHSVEKQIAEEKARRNDYQQRIETTPKIEKIYNSLIAERANTLSKYNDLMQKMMEAKVAHGLEKGQKGERFTLIDPARLPERPFKPNRLAIVIVSFVLGIGAGVALTVLKEFADDSVRSPAALSIQTSFPVLASIPLIQTKEDVALKRRRRFVVAGGIVAGIVVTVTVFHFLIMDLYVFWARLTREISF